MMVAFCTGVEEKDRIRGVVMAAVGVRMEAARGNAAGLIAGAKRDLRSVLAMSGNWCREWSASNCCRHNLEAIVATGQLGAFESLKLDFLLT